MLRTAEFVNVDLNPIALIVAVPIPSCVVALGVLVAVGGDINVPVVVVGVVPSLV